MPIKKYNPTSPGRRLMSVATFEEITKNKPEKSLLATRKRTGGRNNTGRITTRHRGGGHKRYYRIIDFKRDKFGIPGKVAAIEYDPNRSARIALINYADGEKRYILAPLGLRVGETIMSGEQAEVRLGNTLPLRRIPLGTQIHNVELTLGGVDSWSGAQARARSSWPRTRNTRRCASLRARCVWSTSTAWPPLARWATWSTRMYALAKRDEAAGWVAGPRCEAQP